MKADRKTKRTAPGRRPASRPTIGMLINQVVGNHQVQWLGAVDAARTYEANLITFVGRELGNPHESVA